MVMCSCSKWMNPNDLSDPFDLAQPKRPQPSLGASPSSINEFHRLKMAYVIIGSGLFSRGWIIITFQKSDLT